MDSETLVAGPAGALETRLTRPEAPSGGTALLCHPHPQYGGNMNDAVLDVLARELLARGVTVARFNFRGVGRSEGRYDGQGGEAGDVRAMLDWLEAEHGPDAPILGGYSFGAAMAWQACQAGATPSRVLLIAPPVGMMPFEGAPLDCPVAVFAGDQDEFIDAEVLARWQGPEISIIQGANHFFSGRWDQLGAAIRSQI